MWVGHSFGGRLVAELAARDPERVERAVLLDPALQVLPHVAGDLAEMERADVSYASVEDAVQARYDAGRVLLSPRDRVIESDRATWSRARTAGCATATREPAVIAAWSVMASPPPPPGPRADADGARRGLVADARASTSTRIATSSATSSRSSPSRAGTPCTGTRSTRRARRSTRFLEDPRA